MALTELEIRSARAIEKPIKLFDGSGLYLLVQPSGGRWWRFKYRFQGKERELSLGVYPEISLKLARERREEARRTVAQGIDPSAERKAAKEARQVTFELIAEEWLALQAKPLNAHMWDIACLVRLTPNLDMAGVGVKRRGTGHFIADVVSALYAEQLLCRTTFPHSGTQFFPWLHGADSLPETSRFVASCLQTGNRLQTSPDLY
jgi:hypothetical protein